MLGVVDYFACGLLCGVVGVDLFYLLGLDGLLIIGNGGLNYEVVLMCCYLDVLLGCWWMI